MWKDWTAAKQMSCSMCWTSAVTAFKENSAKSGRLKSSLSSRLFRSFQKYFENYLSKSAKSGEDGTDDGEMDVRGVTEG